MSLVDDHWRKHGIKDIDAVLEKQKLGVSSFHMHDPETVFNEMDICIGDTFLDIGCGAGDYSLHAAKIVGEKGVVYALDRWMNVVGSLLEKAESQGLNNVSPLLCDITKGLPIPDRSIDICFIVTVLHCLDLSVVGKRLFSEIKRVLKPEGQLITIDCKKEKRGWGPPLSMRLSPEDIEKIALPAGFQKNKYVDLGSNYMLQFFCK